MKKATFKTYLILLLVFLLSLALLVTAAACHKTTETTEEEPEETTSDFSSLVSNGDFSAFTSGTTQPYSPSNWTSYSPSGSSDENKVAGIIDTGADYDKNRSSWGDLANPYGTATDNKVLMIYNKAENVFGYTNTFSATSNGYYSLSVKVKVVNVDAENGATFRISSDNDRFEFSKINATNEFVTYTFYLQAPTADSTTVTVTLSLGYEDKKVQGYAFFDDVVVKKITEKAFNDAQASDTVKIVSMLYPNGEFNYYNYSSSTSSLKTPTGWTWSNGKNVAGKAVPTSDRINGVISTDATTWDALDADTYGANPALPDASSEDKYVMMIAKNKSSAKYSPTAGYYTANSAVKIDRTSLYEISVWVKAVVDNDDSITTYENKGARVVLDGSDKYESAVINTTDKLGVNNGWAKVTFYVFGNQFRAQDFKIQLWIGNDKSNDTLTQGKVFFDKLSVQKIDISDKSRAQVVDEYSAKEGTFEQTYISYVKFVDLKTEDTKLVINENFTDLDENGLPTAFEFSPVENIVIKDNDVIAKVIPTDELNGTIETNWKEKYGIEENPSFPYSFSPVLIVNNTIPGAYKIQSTDLFEIKQSLCYRISVWMKTIGVDENKTVTLRLGDDEDNEISSFSVNTSTYENDLTNNYVEYCFYLTGEMPVSANNTETSHFVRLTVSNGSGTTYDPSSYQKGAFLIANINMEEITYSEYNNHSSDGNYTKSKDYADNSATITNGNFNSYDRANTTFADDGFVAMQDKDENDHLVGAISSWTNNVDKKYGSTKTDGEWLPDYLITKAADDAENEHKSFDAAINGKTITTIRVVGDDYDKTFNTDSEWSKVLDINTITGNVTLKSGNSLENGDYTVKIKVDEKEHNDLIAGIVNVNASDAYFDQFNIDRLSIFDSWSTTTVPSAATAAKNVTFGAPNVLMITPRDGKTIKLKNTYVDETATNDRTKDPAIKSPSMSLSGNSYYLLRCYGKAIDGAIGQVYVTTTSTDAVFSSYTVENTQGWVEYNFLVETGLSTVTAYFEIYYGKKGDGDTAYSGTLFFDSFSYVSLEKEEFDALSAPENNTATSKFTTMTFDNASASETAVSPSGMSATNSSSSNSDTQVSGIIARENFAYTTSDGKNNLGIYVTKEKEDGSTEDVIEEGSALSASYIFDNAGMEGDATVGDYVLMINNRKATYQSYYFSSLSLSSDAYYSFSAYVRTAKIAKDSFAKVYVLINDEPTTFEVNTEYDKDGKEIENKWQKLTFYFKNEKDSSVTAKLYFELGENSDDGKMQGYLFVDNISLSKITKDEYDPLTADYEVYETSTSGEQVLTAASQAYRLKNKVVVLKQDETEEKEPTPEKEEKPKTSLNTTLLWTYITSIAIAVVLIAVIVVWLVRKYRRPKTTAAEGKKAGYDRTNKKAAAEEPTSTGSARDEFKD